MAVAITRLELGASDLRREAARCSDGPAARRMLALALALEGRSRGEAAQCAGMDRQTLRDWVHRYNAEGIAGLVDRPRPGRPARLSPGQVAALVEIVEAGPDVAVDGVVRWRCADLTGVVANRFEVALSERQVGRILNRQGYTRLKPRPQHPKADEAVQATFKKTSPRR